MLIVQRDSSYTQSYCFNKPTYNVKSVHGNFFFIEHTAQSKYLCWKAITNKVQKKI